MLKLSRIIVIISIFLLVSVFSFATLRPIQVLPRISVGPGFSLTNQDGERLTNEDVRGQFVLYNFVYTSCDAPCSQMNATMQQLQQRLDTLDTGDIPVRLITISIDPAQDTPEQLRAYAEELGADTEQWEFLTGDPDQLKNIIGGAFSTYYEQQPDGSFNFDPAFILTDGWGILRAEYRTATPDLDRIERDIRLIAQEARNSKGASRYAYEAAHLFLCYPR